MRLKQALVVMILLFRQQGGLLSDVFNNFEYLIFNRSPPCGGLVIQIGELAVVPSALYRVREGSIISPHAKEVRFQGSDLSSRSSPRISRGGARAYACVYYVDGASPMVVPAA